LQIKGGKGMAMKKKREEKLALSKYGA
jgi:hypothetical protein